MTTMTSAPNAVRERPILMNGESVRAVLAGTKSQARRVVKGINPDYLAVHQRSDGWSSMCPYGAVGDVLWCRETWRFADWTEDGYPFIAYAVDGVKVLHERYDESWSDRLANIWADLSVPDNYRIDNRAADRRWRSPIHMPRWASRLTLEITGVRVERVQDITESDALAEGVIPSDAAVMFQVQSDGVSVRRAPEMENAARGAFACLWDSLNAKRGHPWASNPWVWVLAFRVLPAHREGR